jgi:monoterpene epsilon-lactone hydrolase
MGLARRIGRIVAASQRTLHRRVRAGPLGPGWSLPYELAVAYLREAFRAEGLPVELVRARMDAPGAVELRRRRVAFRRVDVAGVAAEWVSPPRAGDRVLVYLHGGGYAFGSVSSHRALIAELALRSGQRVLAPEYRLAPEHPCPAAIEDVVAVWRWLIGPGGFRPEQLSLGGDSAGGGLTLASALRLRELGLPLPRELLLLSPWVDLTLAGESYDRFHEVDYLGTREGLRVYADYYRGALPSDDPRVSPLFARLEGLPPVWLLAGGAEILLDDSVSLAARLEAAGVPVRLRVEDGEVHVFPVFSRLTPRGQAALDWLGSALR